VISPDGPEATDGPADADLVSVIIVTHNSAGVIAKALAALRAILPHAEIVVVDNGSADNTCELVAECDGARLISGHGNVGFGSGVNRGAKAAGGRLLLVMNPDAFPTSVDAPALAILAGKTQLGLLGCELFKDGHAQRSVLVRWGWRRELCWSLTEWYLIPRRLELRRPHPRRRSNTWVSGAAFVVNREEFLDIGGFDERLFLYYEDFNLSRAYAARGFPLGSTGSVTLEHLKGASSPRDDDLFASWALLSLIEQTDRWDGGARSRAAARWTWRLLGAIEVLGNCVRPLPWIGRPGRRKAESAARVRHYLLDQRAEDPAASYYPLARAAFRSEIAR
jgi:N-acetylglucosaminyl-diphospho-decaprenol L-rhamnosyltransferase